MKRCIRCHRELPRSAFYTYKKPNGKGTPFSSCKECHRIVTAENYHKHRERNLAHKKTKSMQFKQQCVDYKGGRCSVCGYDKCLPALEFHHVDPSQKETKIGANFSTFKKAKPELDKCILVCANCHRELHYETDRRMI
jgi:hypothetical protein